LYDNSLPKSLPQNVKKEKRTKCTLLFAKGLIKKKHEKKIQKKSYQINKKYFFFTFFYVQYAQLDISYSLCMKTSTSFKCA